MSTAAIVYAFNHDELVKLANSAPDGTKITFALVNVEGKNEMYACAFIGPATQPLTEEPLGCPYPPGWSDSEVTGITVSVEALNNAPAFLLDKTKLQGILAVNKLIIGTTHQLPVTVDADVISNRLTTFMRVSAYNADGSLKVMEEKTDPPLSLAGSLN